MNIAYTPEAVADLVRLRSFIAEKNPSAAARIAGELLRGISLLTTFPSMGTRVEEAPNPELIRDLVVDRYVVRYLIGPQAVFILRVWHHREGREFGDEED